MTGPFSLRALVRSIAESSNSPDPQTLAVEVFAAIDEANVREALRQALPTVVHNVVSTSRMRAPSWSPFTKTTARPGHRQRSARSPKVAAIREAWRAELRQRYPVGPSEYRFLGDCTTRDLDYAVKVRDEQARRNELAAARLRELIEIMIEHNAATVKELPDPVLAEHFNSAA